MELKFLSTLSLRRATPIGSTDICVACDFYPRSPCGERQRSIRCHAKNLTISIHALLAESDAPMAFIAAQRSRFLSTLSLRRATKKGSGKSTTLTNFYPRSPCGERPPLADGAEPHAAISIHALLAESDILLQKENHRPEISIHALLAESDFGVVGQDCVDALFLSTLSLRRATPVRRCSWQTVPISIHALLAESDTAPSENAKSSP